MNFWNIDNYVDVSVFTRIFIIIINLMGILLVFSSAKKLHNSNIAQKIKQFTYNVSETLPHTPLFLSYSILNISNLFFKISKCLENY